MIRNTVLRSPRLLDQDFCLIGGDNLPDLPRYRFITSSVPEEVYVCLKKIAFNHSISVSSLVCAILINRVEDYKYLNGE